MAAVGDPCLPTYDSGENGVSAGDTVIDGGAHIGAFTRYALNKGAHRVVAIEPNPVNIACLRRKRNFANEIENGSVTVVEVGLGKEISSLELAVHEHNTARSLITPHDLPARHKITVPIVPLDNVVENLALERIDFIKMDIEGSERWGLEGGQRTIKRFHPPMAISSYHHEDPAAVTEEVLKAYPGYGIHGKGIGVANGVVQPKVLFFD